MRNNRGQQFIEYLLLLAAVAIVCVIFLKPPSKSQAGGPMSTAVNAALWGIVKDIQNNPLCFAKDANTVCAGIACGGVSNGCGGTVTCPNTCNGVNTCGGGGVANQCGCTPGQCPVANANGIACGQDTCGNPDQNCLCSNGYSCRFNSNPPHCGCFTGPICGGTCCAGGQECNPENSSCCTPDPKKSCGGFTCGEDSCGASCGPPCPNGQTCVQKGGAGEANAPGVCCPANSILCNGKCKAPSCNGNCDNTVLECFTWKCIPYMTCTLPMGQICRQYSPAQECGGCGPDKPDNCDCYCPYGGCQTDINNNYSCSGGY